MFLNGSMAILLRHTKNLLCLFVHEQANAFIFSTLWRIATSSETNADGGADLVHRIEFRAKGTIKTEVLPDLFLVMII